MLVRIYAHFCRFEPRDGYVARTHAPLDPFAYLRDGVEVRNAAELNAALDAAVTETRAKFPGRSFFVSEYRPRGAKDRAFAGYNRGRWLREFDAARDATDLERAKAQFGDRLEIVSV